MHHEMEDLDDPGILQARLREVVAELRSANDELAAQAKEIGELLAREEDARATLRAVTGPVPVALLTTDAAGTVLEANPAAGVLLGVGTGRLLREPLHEHLAAGDRDSAAALLEQALATGSATATVTVLPRHGAATEVEASLRLAPEPWTDTRTPGGVPQVQWTLVPLAATGRGGGRIHEALHAMAALRHLPVGEVTTAELLARVSTLVRRAVGPADWCSVTLGSPLEPEAQATESAEAQRLDGAQWRAGQGPCETAHRTGVPVVSPDLRTDARWPALASRLAADDVPGGSALAVPVTLAGDVLGVVNLYSACPGVLGAEDDCEHALVFAEAVAAVVRDARRMESLRGTAAQLQEAMRSRAVIEQAKGVVAGWLGCGVDQAWEVLSSLSQDRNVKLRELAALVVADAAEGTQVRGLLEHQRGRLLARAARTSG